MTRFDDGPAAGQVLRLQRAPVFLRVVIEGEKIDALDQPEDTPSLSEKIVVYLRRGTAGRCFLDWTGANGRRQGGCFTMANYRYYQPQPTEATMRDPQLWHEWCLAQIPQLFT